MSRSHDPLAAPRPTPAWAGSRVVLLGLARSGRAAAELLGRRGAVLVCIDDGPKPQLPDATWPRVHAAKTRAHPSDLDGAVCLVLSPGVPRTHALVQAALRRDVPVWSEIEVAYRESTSPVIAVTGSKGKSTTTAWIQHLMQGLGQTCVLAGNIGIAYSSVVDACGPDDWIALEVSSFQLESVDAFHARAAVHLHLSPDHLDRYADFDAYACAKARIAGRQTQDDVLVVDPQDAYGARLAQTAAARVVGYGEPWRGTGVALEGDDFVWRDGGRREVLAGVADVPLIGAHNRGNAMAALAVCRALGVWRPTGRAALRSFAGLEFRMQPCGEIAGVRVVNDSKSTTVDSVRAALEGLDVPVVLAVGGRNKGLDFGGLRAALGRVRAVITYGEDGPAIAAALAGAARIVPAAADLDDVVARALDLAQPGDTFVFSPGCTSFDMFANAEARGHAFDAAVRRARDTRRNTSRKGHA